MGCGQMFEFCSHWNRNMASAALWRREHRRPEWRQGHQGGDAGCIQAIKLVAEERDGEKCSDSGYILEVESQQLIDKMDWGQKKRRGIRNDFYYSTLSWRSQVVQKNTRKRKQNIPIERKK